MRCCWLMSCLLHVPSCDSIILLPLTPGPWGSESYSCARCCSKCFPLQPQNKFCTLVVRERPRAVHVLFLHSPASCEKKIRRQLFVADPTGGKKAVKSLFFLHTRSDSFFCPCARSMRSEILGILELSGLLYNGTSFEICNCRRNRHCRQKKS